MFLRVANYSAERRELKIEMRADGDLVDTLVDARAPLADTGVIWVLTPKTGRDGHVEPSDIAEAASTVGLAQTSNISVSEDWTATRLATPKAAKSKR